MKYIKHPLKQTEIGMATLRCRLSLRETQNEFAKRFMVTPVTVHNWETGKSQFIQKIHRQILVTLLEKLKKEGLYLPEPVFTAIYRAEFEKRGSVGN